MRGPMPLRRVRSSGSVAAAATAVAAAALAAFGAVDRDAACFWLYLLRPCQSPFSA